MAWDLAALALKHRLPVMAWGVWFAQVGCLMAYSADYTFMMRRLAFYVDKILKGAKPAEAYVEDFDNSDDDLVFE